MVVLSLIENNAATHKERGVMVYMIEVDNMMNLARSETAQAQANSLTSILEDYVQGKWYLNAFLLMECSPNWLVFELPTPQNTGPSTIKIIIFREQLTLYIQYVLAVGTIIKF